MTNQERLARQWAEDLKNGVYGSFDDESSAAADYILDNIEPQTPPTMADVEWDDNEHYLAGATNGIDNNERVMLCPRNGMILNAPLGGDRVSSTTRGALTPNGKRYELCEVGDKPLEPSEPSTKTMDEYSPVERADMVGMWAGYNRHKLGGEPEDFLIITGEETEAGRVPCYNPGAPIPHAWAPDKWMLTPRFDMPRAWGKDGEPCEPTVSSNENVGVDQPDHPEVLTTLRRMESAPVGTVISDGVTTLQKESNDDGHGWWWQMNLDGAYLSSKYYAYGREFTVLRWGWGDEA